MIVQLVQLDQDGGTQMDKKKIPFSKTADYCETMLFHPLDIEYFKDYPAPLIEVLQAQHYTNLNSTITFFGPMLYFLARALCCEHILEIGMAEGYTSFYLASAVKDNGVRFGMKGNMYYGIDIIKTDLIRDRLNEKNLPNTILKLDSMKLTPETFKGVTFDMIFQDGCHDTEHIIYEFDTMWKQIKTGGKGYWIMHDVQGPGEEGYKIIRDKILNKEINAEFVALDCVYGLGIIRKLDGFDYNKKNWVE